MKKNCLFNFLILSLIISSSSLHAVKKKNTKQQPNSNIETTITHDVDNPISDPEEFGFSHLKTWNDLNSRKQINKQHANTDRLSNALNAKNQGNIELAKQLLKEGARQNCDNAMLHLGCLEEEKGNFEEAYTWYMISLCSKILKGNKLTTIQTQKNNPYDRLLSIIKNKNLPEGYKKFTTIFMPCVNNAKNKNDTINAFMQSFYDLTHYNQKLSAFAFELSKWSNNKDAFCILGQIFNKEYNLPEIAASFLRLSKTDFSLSILTDMIYKKRITTDLNGKEFIPENMNHAIGEITLKIKTPTPDQLSNLGIFICNGTISTLNGKTIPKNKKYEIGATYLRKAQTNVSYYEIGSLILNNKIQHDEDNIQIHPNNKFDVAARNFRKSGLPHAMVDIAKLLYNDNIAQDENGNIIPEERKYNVIERITKKYIEIPYSKTLLAKLIMEKKINTDEYNQEFSEDQRYEMASRLLIKSPNTDSYDVISFLILSNHIDPKKGLKMLGYDQANSLTKEEIIAELCRRSKSSWALHVLGMYIYHGLTDKDENNNHINENQRIETSCNILQQSKEPNALYDLTIFKLQHTPTQSIETLKDILHALEKAILGGCSRAAELYHIVSDRIALSEQPISELQKKTNETITNLSTDKDESTSFNNNAENLFSTTTSEKYIAQDLSEKNNSNEENILSLEARKKLKALKKATKTKKRIQKYQELINGQLPQNKINSLLCDTTNPQNEHITKWNKEAWSQFNTLLKHEKERALFLIDDIKEDGNRGHPEKLQGSNIFSRRITQEHRLVYHKTGNKVEILSCKGHYGIVVEGK